MKPSSKILCGLLVSCLCFRVTDSSEEISVIQNPPNITVCEGESSNITCCWITTIKPKVVWYKNEKRISAENKQLQIFPVNNCSTLHITNITPNDKGDYMCKVVQDRPVLMEFNGTKTVITVLKKEQCTMTPTTEGSVRPTLQPNLTTTVKIPESPSQLILPLSLAAIVVLLTFCLVFSVCKMRNSCKNSERVVIRQTPHIDGEEHENMEELSTGSSRGSVQWYQVPVYWSYFDLRRGEDQ